MVADSYVAWLPVSRAQLRVFDESAHFPNVEEPERYVGEIAVFLQVD